MVRKKWIECRLMVDQKYSKFVFLIAEKNFTITAIAVQLFTLVLTAVDVDVATTTKQQLILAQREK